MTSTRRCRSISGFYHVVARGNGKQYLFDDDEDRSKFLSLLENRLEKFGLVLLAWCLMGNHVHLLLMDVDGSLSKMMQSLTSMYARWRNEKDERSGHVFEGRFRSRVIETEEYLLEAVRYIHNNPAKGGLARAAEYRWSSYREYVSEPWITNTSLVLTMLGGARGFEEFCDEVPACAYHPLMGSHVDEEDAREVAELILDGESPARIAEKAYTERVEVVHKLQEGGLTVNQIVRLTGMGRQRIRTMLKN